MISKCTSLGIAFVSLLLASNAAADERQRAVYALAGNASSEETIQAILDSAGDDRETVRLRNFYAARDYRPVWSSGDYAAVLRSVLDHAYQQGLRPRDYTDALSAWTDPPQAGAEAARYDVAMTRALFSYARDVRLGRVAPGDVYKDVDLPRWSFDIGPALSTALRRGRTLESFLAALPPPRPAYRRLVQALERYRDIAMHGGWPRVAPGSPDVEGDGNRLAILTQRLAREDAELASTPDPTASDTAEALIRFQRRMGLADDGVLGADTLAALNIGAAYRVEQIAANMERWRWMPPDLESRYIMVNVPDQSLDFVNDGASVLHSRVIIGKKKSPTPIMRATVLTVVANPPWNVPDDIAAAQILPHARRSSNYLKSRDMVFVSGHVQQNPGDNNVLGKVMLDSPNDFGVYLHDTPNKSLFEKSTREFSNGCVRVEEILPLAAMVMQLPDSDDSALGEAIASGSTQRLSVPASIPVYTVYFTAIADQDGTVEFRPDRYDRDQRLIARVGRLLPKPENKTPERKVQARI